MKPQAKAQDALPIEEVGRHPMWTPPGKDEEMPKHIRALRAEIAKRLTPFDGRPGAQSVVVIEFCKNVYTASCMRSAHEDPLWLLGQIVLAYSDSDLAYPAIKHQFDLYIEAVITNSNVR